MREEGVLLKEFSELMKYVCWASEGKLSSSAIPIMDMLLTDGTKKTAYWVMLAI